jgi:hypothetical protein|tara:strand:- start:196 stop:468 length:273 start_codon:yes stop_codon:yes gene_type:complete
MKMCDCNKNYGNKDLQGNHDIDCESRKGDALYCNKCNKKFNSPEELNKNEWDEWVKESSFICSSCINKEMFAHTFNSFRVSRYKGGKTKK